MESLGELRPGPQRVVSSSASISVFTGGTRQGPRRLRGSQASLRRRRVGLGCTTFDLRAPCTCPASAASKMSGVTAHSPGKNSPGAGGGTVAGLLDVWPPRSLERLSGTSAVQSNNLQPGAGKRPAQGHRTLASVTPCSTVDPRRGRKTGPGYTAALSQAPPLSIIIAVFSELSPVLPCGAAGRGGIGLCPHDAHPRNNRNGDSSRPPSTQRVPGTS